MRCRLTALVFTSVTLPALVFAQDAPHPFGMSLGAMVERGSGQYGLGIQLGGQVTAPVGRRVGVRFDAGYAHFDGEPYAINEPPLSGSGITDLPPSNTLDVWSTTVSVAFREPPTEARRLTWIAGLGLYRMNDNGQMDHYTLAGWNLRISIPVGTRASLDLGYHGLIDARNSRGFVPISLTIGL